MKTKLDPRHIRRIKIMRQLFAWNFNHQLRDGTEDVKEIITHLDQIDQLINKSAPAWPIAKINQIDLAILRQSIFEIIIKKDVPVKVIVDEAVELAKEFGSDSSPSFVNGALGKLIEDQKLITK